MRLHLSPSRPLPWTAIRLGVAVVLGVAAFAVFGYWSLSLVDRAEQIDVVAAAKDLTAPRVLAAEDLLVLRMRREFVPATAIADRDAMVGSTLVRPLSAREVLTTNALLGRTNPDLGGFAVPAGMQGIVIPAAWLAGPMPRVAKGDTVTILASGSAGTGKAPTTSLIASHAPVHGVAMGSDGVPSRILLAVEVPTAAALLSARTANAMIAVTVDGLGPPL